MGVRKLWSVPTPEMSDDIDHSQIVIVSGLFVCHHGIFIGRIVRFSLDAISKEVGTKP